MNGDKRWLHVLYGILGFLGSVWVGVFLMSITPKGIFPDLPILLTMAVGIIISIFYTMYHLFDIIDHPRER